MLLRMGEIIALNMLSWLGLLINTINVASSWLFILEGGSNMTGTDVARFTHKQSRSYLNHLVLYSSTILSIWANSSKPKLHSWKSKHKYMFKGNVLHICNTNPRNLSQNSLWIYKRKNIIRLRIVNYFSTKSFNLLRFCFYRDYQVPPEKVHPADGGSKFPRKVSSCWE